MNAKKIIFPGVCAFVLGIAAFTQNCSATISPNQLALGGIPCVGKGSSYVTKIYGTPTRGLGMESFGTYDYGGTAFVDFSEGTVTSITVTANNGWKTPAGLRVGMTANEAVRMYGDPDKSEARGDKRIYIYFVDYLRKGAGHLGICFDNTTKKITKLNVMHSTMADFDEYYPGWLDGMFK